MKMKYSNSSKRLCSQYGSLLMNSRHWLAWLRSGLPIPGAQLSALTLTRPTSPLAEQPQFGNIRSALCIGLCFIWSWQVGCDRAGSETKLASAPSATKSPIEVPNNPPELEKQQSVPSKASFSRDGLDEHGFVVLKAPEAATATESTTKDNVSAKEKVSTSDSAQASRQALAAPDIILDDVPSSPPPGAKFGTPTLALASDVRETSSSTSASAGTIAAVPVATAIADSEKNKLPAEANVATEEEKHQKIAEDWKQPQAVLFITGQQHGYLEPCGCTGLDKQKGGINRRDTLLQSLRARNWEIIPIDVGNQVRRPGRQPEIQFQTTAEVFKSMGYRAVALGIDDLQLSSGHLLAFTVSDKSYESPFISANASVFDPSLMTRSQIVQANGRKIGITAVLGDGHKREVRNSEIVVEKAIDSLAPVVRQLQEAGCNFLVLLAHASEEESREIARAVPGFNVVITSGGLGEPTYKEEPIEGSKAVMLQVGVKGMYVGLLGIFDDADRPIRYQKVALSSQFKDSPRMLELFARYQGQLKSAGFEGLGLNPNSHPTGNQFVGSETCGECHTKAYAIWKDSPHFKATQDLIEPGERTNIPRHFDPECISCHATGWNAQQFYPYASGFWSQEKTPKMTGSGCENCHGPGSNHVAAEQGDLQVDAAKIKQLQEEMRLPLAKARDKCLECHDLDNSPDFHPVEAFESYWKQVEHIGKD